VIIRSCLSEEQEAERDRQQGTDQDDGIDDQFAGLALADIATQFLRLFDGRPQRAGVTFHHGSRPQHHDIDSLVGDEVVTKRAGDLSGGVIYGPRPHPRPHALLKIGGDPIGDLAVYVTKSAHGPNPFPC
jgi:hypothetical protein